MKKITLGKLILVIFVSLYLLSLSPLSDKSYSNIEACKDKELVYIDSKYVCR